jgi:hypothetical protein
MGTIPASFLPPRARWPERVYLLSEHATYPERLNSTEELIDRHVEAGHGDRVAILYEDQRITYRQLQASVMVQRRAEPTTPLGQILVRQGVITQRQLNNVLDRYRKKYRLGDILVETETITEYQLQIALDHQKKTGSAGATPSSSRTS